MADNRYDIELANLLYKELQTKIGEGCDANPEVITETKESVTP